MLNRGYGARAASSANASSHAMSCIESSIENWGSRGGISIAKLLDDDSCQAE
jgi:hypothetical protein